MPGSEPASKDADADVVAEVGSGNHHRALTLLMARYGKAVYQHAFQMTRDHMTADDVRQQTFVDAFRGLGQFAGRSVIKTWLFGIAHHRCLDALKLRDRWERRYKNDADEPVGDAAIELASELDRERIASVVSYCLGRLTPAAREAVALRYQQELSYEQVASITGERIGTLQQRVARALPALRRCVSARIYAAASAKTSDSVEAP